MIINKSKSVITLTQIKVFLMILAYLIMNFLLEHENLPDYESYNNIFSDPENFKSWNLLFTLFLGYFSIIFSYETFRFTCFLLGLILFVRLPYKMPGKYIILLFFITTIVLLEFYMIRLRGGISLSLFFISYYLYRNYYRLIASLPLLISLLIHPGTFFTLFVAFLPFIFKLKLNLFSYFFLIFTWVVFLLCIDVMAQGRGSHLHSDINVFRVLALMVLPTLFYFIVNKFNLGKLNVTDHTEFIAYHTLSIACLSLYCLGVFSTSGEAIIRVYSLIAGPTLLFGLIRSFNTWRIDQLMVALCVLSANSLFFINTVYL